MSRAAEDDMELLGKEEEGTGGAMGESDEEDDEDGDEEEYTDSEEDAGHFFFNNCYFPTIRIYGFNFQKIFRTSAETCFCQS